MVRSLILRIPVLRALVPRVSRPLLPLTKLASASTDTTAALARRPSTSRLFHTMPARLSSSSSPSSSRAPSPESQQHPEMPPNPSLSQRLRYLIKSYGWYALGVYIVLSVADFGVAFAAVNVLGAEHVGRVAAAAKEAIAGMLPQKVPEPGREDMDSAASHAAHAHGASEGFWAMLVLAYTIHKTLFLPFRVGLTAYCTPRMVGWLRTRGWAGGAGTVRAAQEIREKVRARRDLKGRD